MKYVIKRAKRNIVHAPHIAHINLPFSEDGTLYTSDIASAGRGVSASEALHGAIGEWLDRHVLCKRPHETLSFSDLNEQQLALIQRDDLLGNLPDNEKKSLEFVVARRMFDGQEYAFPRSFFYFNDLSAETDSPKSLPQCDTTGCSSHTNLEFAIENSMQEIVEKNSICIAFSGKRTLGRYPDTFVFRSLSERLSECVQYWQGTGSAIRCYDVSFIENTPTVLTLWLAENQDRLLGIGAACSHSTQLAIQKSVLETFQLMHYYSDAQPNGFESSEDFYLSYARQPPKKWVPFFDDDILMDPKPIENPRSLDWFKRSRDAFFHIYPQSTFAGRVAVKVIHLGMLYSLIPPTRRLNRTRSILKARLGHSQPERFPFP